MSGGAAADAVLRAMGRSVALVDRAAMVLCTLLLICMVLLAGFEAVRRNLENSSLYAVQVSVALSTVVYFLGYSVLLNRDQDVTVVYFYDRLPRLAQVVVMLAIRLGTVAFFALLLSASLDYYHLTSFIRSQVLPVQQSATVIPIIVGAASCLWVAIYKAAMAIRACFA